MSEIYVCGAKLYIDAENPHDAAMGYLREIATRREGPLWVTVNGEMVMLSAKDVAEALGHKSRETA